ncbi:MAG: hypothetical protein V1716_02600 [Candidatus Uhrbacteria bacterium]
MSKKAIGAFLMVGPFGLLVLTLALYAISSFVLTAVGGQNVLIVASVIRIVLGLVGFVSVVGIVPCFIIGLVMVLKK